MLIDWSAGDEHNHISFGACSGLSRGTNAPTLSHGLYLAVPVESAKDLVVRTVHYARALLRLNALDVRAGTLDSTASPKPDTTGFTK